MRVGVIGAGVMGKFHVRVYHELGVELVGVADINRNSAEEIANRYRTRAFTDYEELLGQGLDVVSIAVPTRLHSEVAVRAASHGVNMLVEKPIADSIDNAKKMIDVARKANLKLMTGHIERFNPAVQKLKEIIEEGVLGDLIVLSSRRVGPFAQRITDVGITMDMATHDIDIARYLTGSEPVEILAKSSKVKHQKGDCALMLIDFGYVTASIEVNWFTPHKVRTLVVTGTKGIAYADYIEQSVIIYNSSWKMEPKIEKDEPLRLELKHFLECVEQGKEPMITGEDGLKTLEIALKIERTSFKQ